MRSVSYGSLEPRPGMAPSQVRKALIFVAALSAVALGCILVISNTERDGWSSLEQRVAVPPHDFTASKDKHAYDAYFSKLDEQAKEQEATEKSGDDHTSYRSADAARNDIDSFFDNLAVNKKQHLGLTASEANKQLDDIFPTHEKKLAQKEQEQDKKEQQLALSANQAQDDLDSYFDSLPSKKHEAHKESNESDQTKKYIEAKRAAMDKNGGSFTTFDEHGKIVKTAQKWSSEEARKQLDDIFGTVQPRQQPASLNKYEQKHPGFEKQLEMAHKDWMKTHDGPPRTAREKDEYHKLVASENPADDDSTHVVIEAYLKQHPDVAAKFKQLHDEWYAKHKTPPHSDAEKAEYKADMLRIVGVLNIDSKAVLAQNSDTQAKKQDDKATAKDTAGDDKASVVQTYMQSHPDVQAKIDKVHAMWAKNHNQPPQTDAEKKEYDDLLAKYVGQVDMSAKKQTKTMSLATAKKHTAAEEERARQNALKDYERKHPGMLKKIDKVHKIWSQTHKSAPSTPAENKEYDDLMAKYVGHPDVSEFYDKDDNSAKKQETKNYMNLDAAFLNKPTKAKKDTKKGVFSFFNIDTSFFG